MRKLKTNGNKKSTEPKEGKIVPVNPNKKNCVKEIALFNCTKDIEGNQIMILGGVNYAEEVGGSQAGVVVGVNRAKKIGEHQGGIAALVNYAEEVGDSQNIRIGGVNYAGKVGGTQRGIGVLINRTKEVGGSQVMGIGIANYAEEVGGTQGGIVALVNCAGKVGKDQRTGIGGIINIQTKNKKAIQDGAIFSYNPLEGLKFGSSVWKKIDDAEKYLDALELSSSPEEYQDTLRELGSKKETFVKRITGHYTFKDSIYRQARKRIKGVESR